MMNKAILLFVIGIIAGCDVQTSAASNPTTTPDVGGPYPPHFRRAEVPRAPLQRVA
jgi:hypothetical protein